MTVMVFVLTGLALSIVAGVSVMSYRVGRSKGFGEIFHIRMEAAQARRRMHDLTRRAFTTMSEAAESVRDRQPGHSEN